MEAYGHTWRKLDNDSVVTTFRAIVHERFHVLTWPFGPNFHQAKVVVAYEHADGHHTCVDGNSVGIGLDGGSSRKAAMRCGLDWVERFRQTGVPSPEVTIAECFREYPDLFKIRPDVLYQLFASGHGYEWLDGGRYAADQAAPPDFSDMKETADRMDELRQQVWDTFSENDKCLHPEMEPDPPEPTERPLPDDGGYVDWRMADLDPLFNVPSDVDSDWIQLAMEAALVIKMRMKNPKDAERGAQLHTQLQAQFFRNGGGLG